MTPQKVLIVNPTREIWPHEFTREAAQRAQIEIRKTNIAGQYGFRVRSLTDATADVRLILAAARYADDHALGVQGVRGERLGLCGSDLISGCGGFTQTRLDALKRLREADAFLMPVDTQIVRDIVVDCVSALELSRRWKISGKTAGVWALKALNRLADWFETPKKRDLRPDSQ